MTVSVVNTPILKHARDAGLEYYSQFEHLAEGELITGPVTVEVVSGDVTVEPGSEQIVASDTTLNYWDGTSVTLRQGRAVRYKLNGGTPPADNKLAITASSSTGIAAVEQPVEVKGSA